MAQFGQTLAHAVEAAGQIRDDVRDLRPRLRQAGRAADPADRDPQRGDSCENRLLVQRIPAVPRPAALFLHLFRRRGQRADQSCAFSRCSGARHRHAARMHGEVIQPAAAVKFQLQRVGASGACVAAGAIDALLKGRVQVSRQRRGDRLQLALQQRVGVIFQDQLAARRVHLRAEQAGRARQRVVQHCRTAVQRSRFVVCVLLL